MLIFNIKNNRTWRRKRQSITPFFAGKLFGINMLANQTKLKVSNNLIMSMYFAAVSKYFTLGIIINLIAVAVESVVFGSRIKINVYFGYNNKSDCRCRRVCRVRQSD